MLACEREGVCDQCIAWAELMCCLVDARVLVGHFSLNAIQDMHKCSVRKFSAFCRTVDQPRVAEKRVRSMP